MKVLLSVVAFLCLGSWISSCFRRDVVAWRFSTGADVAYVADGGTIAFSAQYVEDPFMEDGFNYFSRKPVNGGCMGNFGFSNSSIRTEIELPFWVIALGIAGAGVGGIAWQRSRNKKNMPNKAWVDNPLPRPESEIEP
jgi:hypothetical protein